MGLVPGAALDPSNVSTVLYVEIFHAGHSGLVCSLGLGTAMLFVMHHVMAMLLRTPSTLGYPPTIPLGILLVVPRRLVRLHHKSRILLSDPPRQENPSRSSDQVSPGKVLTKFGTFVASLHSFDAAAFGLSPSEVPGACPPH